MKLQKICIWSWMPASKGECFFLLILGTMMVVKIECSIQVLLNPNLIATFIETRQACMRMLGKWKPRRKKHTKKKENPLHRNTIACKNPQFFHNQCWGKVCQYWQKTGQTTIQSNSTEISRARLLVGSKNSKSFF